MGLVWSGTSAELAVRCRPHREEEHPGTCDCSTDQQRDPQFLGCEPPVLADEAVVAESV